MEKTHALTMATMTGEVGAGALVGWEVILLDDDAAPSAAAGSLRSSLRNSMNSPRDAQQELPEGTVFVIGYKMRAGRTTLHEIARPVRRRSFPIPTRGLTTLPRRTFLCWWLWSHPWDDLS
eukprot:COSAG04_NODE_338_length_16370_cov_18.584230_16_plen_121_part_00